MIVLSLSFSRLPITYAAYHYGVSVNGFHPQRSLDEPYLYKSLSANRGALPDPVPVVDARHSDVGSKRVKNAKEQKRAHRISELIDQLRVKMEKGGWNVGIKSKFHTLSSYVACVGGTSRTYLAWRCLFSTLYSLTSPRTLSFYCIPTY
jgi:hypothetical protein